MQQVMPRKLILTFYSEIFNLKNILGKKIKFTFVEDNPKEPDVAWLENMDLIALAFIASHEGQILATLSTFSADPDILYSWHYIETICKDPHGLPRGVEVA